jgi:hypothetical protein
MCTCNKFIFINMLEYNTHQIFQRMCCPGLDLDRHVQYETLNPTPSGLVRLVSTKKAKLFFHSLNHRRSGCTREGEGLLHYSLQLQATCRKTGRQKKVPIQLKRQWRIFQKRYGVMKT